MLRQVLIFSFTLLAIAMTSCTKSEDDLRKAQRETASLMPDNDPKFEAEYVSDQSQVKLVAARNISYEPLDSFRGKSKSKSEGDEPANDEKPKKKTAGAMPKSARATGAAPPGAPLGGSFWSRVGMKALMGGAPPPGHSAAPPAKPPTKGGKPDAKGDKADEKKKPADDKDADEEESEDEDSGDKDSKDSNSDGN